MKRMAIVVTAAAVVAAGAVPGARAAARCTDRTGGARRLTLGVEGERATGRYALPNRRPRALVVFAHGYGHTSASWVGHMAGAARRGVVAVAMDYRGIEILPDSDGDGLPGSRGWNVTTGAEDSIAAARHFESRCGPFPTVVLFGVSMGANASGLALAHRPIGADGSPLFDYWFDVEGATNLIETYNEARAASGISDTAVTAKEDIEAETGGTFEEVPGAYVERTVVARTPDIAASGVRGAVVVHGIDDGLIPYNQGREMATALAAAGVPVDMFTVGRRSEQTERDTSATSYVMNNLDPNYESPIAGHASEKSDTHIVMVTAFHRLWALLRGAEIGPYREFVVDGELGTVPAP